MEGITDLLIDMLDIDRARFEFFADRSSLDIATALNSVS